MAKGIIVLDKIPQTCQYIRGNKEEGCPLGGMFCQICDIDVMEHVVKGTKPDWCPIRSVPERFEVRGKYPQAGEPVPSYKIGWNACLDEIDKLCKDGGGYD